jgi:hypothetical protein
LIALVIDAFIQKKPLLQDWMLAFPVLAILLCFAARRTIQNSEGTRTSVLYGIDLVKVAFWISLILGLCYAAYLIAVAFAIRRDARTEVEKWMEYVNKSEEEDVTKAFLRTVPPGARQDPDIKRARRDEFLMFRNSDLLRISQRNKGELKYEQDSVAWAYKPGMTEALVTGTVTCPEGKFPISVSLKGLEGVSSAEGGGGRQWMIERPRVGGFIDESRTTRTPYGWLVLALEETGTRIGKIYVDRTLRGGPGSHVYTYHAFIAEKGNPQGWDEVARDPFWQLGFAAPTAITFPNDYKDYTEKHLFKLRGLDPKNDEDKKRAEVFKQGFKNSWERVGIRPAGEKLKGPDGSVIDKESLVTITDTAVEIRVPIEIPLLGGAKAETARGHIVVESKDPALLAELKDLKSKAKPEDGISTPPEDLLQRQIQMRVVRIESDMIPIAVAQPQPKQ